MSESKRSTGSDAETNDTTEPSGRAIAVAFVHGMGAVDRDFADTKIAKLTALFREKLSDSERETAALVAEPVYWADITHATEEEVWERVTEDESLDYMELRRFTFNMAGDTLAYQPSEGRVDLYRSVHRRVADSLASLSEQAGEAAPLCVVAHSLGSVVMHNFLYDLQHDPPYLDDLPKPETALARGETLVLLCTYGSPIAIWRLRFGDDYRAIEFPHPQVAERFPDLDAKWLNIYDADDILAYPIGNLTDRYQTLRNDGILEDRRRDVGGLLTGWSPLSHYDYLSDGDSIEDLADTVVGMWRSAYA